MKRQILAVFGLVLAVAWTPAFAADPTPDQQKEVMDTLQAMGKATVGKDIPALRKLFSDDIMYGHSAGFTQTKEQVLTLYVPKAALSGMDFLNPVIHVYGNVALAKVLTIMHHGPGKDGKVEPDSRNDILWVLNKGGNGWQIVARQVTRAQETK